MLWNISYHPAAISRVQEENYTTEKPPTYKDITVQIYFTVCVEENDSQSYILVSSKAEISHTKKCKAPMDDK